MPVTRADEMDTRPADNAKELLALADEIRDGGLAIIHCHDKLGAIDATQKQRDMIEGALRLSARQQASVEELSASIYLHHGVAMDTGMQIARALLAKYDIFEKAEG